MGVTEKAEFLLELMDVNGGMVLAKTTQFTSTNSEDLLDISAIPKGVYLFRITSKDGNSKTIKLIKDWFLNNIG